jgi:hypothetical protein
MKLRKAAAAGVLAGLGFLFLGTNPAGAAGPGAGPQWAAAVASGHGVASGNSIAAPIAIPIGICGNGNGIGVLGLGAGFAACDVHLSGSGSSGPTASPQQAVSVAHGGGLLAGNAVAVPIAVPVEVACNLNGLGIAGVGYGGSVCDL